MAENPASSDIHRSVLIYRGGFYGKVAAAVVVITIALYLLHKPTTVPNGGTWLGYTLGTIGFGLIAWLAWFGIRKRQYGPKKALLEEWLSAHVYLGIALIVVATLHTAFRFGWNVHTLAFVLMTLVIFSGIFGLYAYRRYPALMTENRNGVSLKAIVSDVVALDQRCRELSLAFDDKAVALVRDATCVVSPRVGWKEVMSGRTPEQVLHGPTGAAVGYLRGLIATDPEATPRSVLALVQALTERVALVERARRDYRYRVLMMFWRAIHVPLTVGLLVALTIHVFSVFYYW